MHCTELGETGQDVLECSRDVDAHGMHKRNHFYLNLMIRSRQDFSSPLNAVHAKQCVLLHWTLPHQYMCTAQSTYLTFGGVSCAEVGGVSCAEVGGVRSAETNAFLFFGERREEGGTRLSGWHGPADLMARMQQFR